MHTSPWSTGVTRWLGSSWYVAGTVDSAAGAYFSNTPACRARLRKVLSTPKKTSPTGFDFVRITWLSAAPASPACSTFTLMPVWRSNAFRTDFDTAKESWVTSVIVVGEDAADDGLTFTVVIATHDASTATRNARRIDIRRPFGIRGARRATRRGRA